MNSANVSLSYEYGFNNFVAWFAVAVLLSSLFLCQWFLGGNDTLCRRVTAILFHPNELAQNHLFNRVVFGIALGITVLIIAWFFVVPTPAYGEMNYFVSRLELMALGYRPFTDFKFTYGPAMLYPSLWLYQAAGGRISIENSYAVALGAHWVSGLGMLAYVIRSLGIVRKITIFLCISVVTVNFSLGLNYTPLRFVCALATLCVMHRWLPARIRLSTSILVLAMALGFSMLCFSISSEVGLGLALSLTVYFGLRGALEGWHWLTGLVGALLSFPLAYQVFGRGYAEMLLSSGGGGLNFPIYPTAHVLLFLAALCTVLPVCACAGLRQMGSSRAFAGGLVTLLGLGIPPALGRCDWGHLFFNGLGSFILALALLSTVPQKAVRRVGFATFLFAFSLGAWVVFWGQYRSMVVDVLKFRGRQMGLQLPENDQAQSVSQKVRDDLVLVGQVISALRVSRSRTSAGWEPTSSRLIFSKRSTREVDAGLAKLLLTTRERVGTPLGIGTAECRFLRSRAQGFVEFNEQPTMLLDARDTAQKLRDLAQMSVILVPRPALREPLIQSPIEEARANSKFISQLLLFPVRFPTITRNSYKPDNFVRAEIRRSFIEIGRTDDLILLKAIQPIVPSRSSLP